MTGHIFTPEERRRFWSVVLETAKAELADHKPEVAIGFLELLSTFLGEEYALGDFQEVHRLLYDAYFSASFTHEAHTIADKLHACATTEEDKVEAALMKNRCLSLLDPPRAVDSCCEVLLNFAKIDVRKTAELIARQDGFSVTALKPFLPNRTPSRLHILVQRLLAQNILSFYSVDVSMGASVVYHGMLHAQVSGLATTHPLYSLTPCRRTERPYTRPTPFLQLRIFVQKVCCLLVLKHNFAKRPISALASDFYMLPVLYTNGPTEF